MLNLEPLEDRRMLAVTIADSLPDVLVVGEDHNNSEIDLGLYFEDLETSDAELVYEVIGNSDTSLFSTVEIDGQVLTLDYAPDAFGEAMLSVRATDADGNWAELDLDVAALPVNDRPTTTGFTDISVAHGTTSTVIDLFAMFDDLEDADHAADLRADRKHQRQPVQLDRY